jgi:hypothetical protein
MTSILGRLLRTSVQLVGYTLAFFLEAGWHLAHSRKDLAGAAIGKWGKAITDAFAAISRI